MQKYISVNSNMELNKNDYKNCSCGVVAIDVGKDSLKKISNEEYEKLFEIKDNDMNI